MVQEVAYPQGSDSSVLQTGAAVFESMNAGKHILSIVSWVLNNAYKCHRAGTIVCDRRFIVVISSLGSRLDDVKDIFSCFQMFREVIKTGNVFLKIILPGNGNNHSTLEWEAIFRMFHISSLLARAMLMLNRVKVISLPVKWRNICMLGAPSLGIVSKFGNLVFAYQKWGELESKEKPSQCGNIPSHKMPASPTKKGKHIDDDDETEPLSLEDQKTKHVLKLQIIKNIFSILVASGAVFVFLCQYYHLAVFLTIVYVMIEMLAFLNHFFSILFYAYKIHYRVEI